MVKTKVKDPELVKRRQQQICRGAMKVFRKKGFHAAPIREIAAACRMSLGNLYNYIETKEDILFLAHKMILDQIYLQLDRCMERYENPVDQLVNLVREILLMTFRLKDEILFVYTETKSLDKEYLAEVLEREREFVGAIESLIRRGVNQGLFNSSNAKVLANVIAYFVAIVPLRGWNILPDYGEEEVIDELVGLVRKLASAQYDSEVAGNTGKAQQGRRS